MSGAAKPEQRRGPVGMQHPLELGVDPETGEELAAPTKGPRKPVERLPGKDRFKLDPAPKGWFRGHMTNVVRSFETTEYGQLVTYHFDVIRERKEPPLKCEMKGYTFSKEIRPGLVVEAFIGDTLPEGRVAFDLMRLPLDPQNDLRAHRPVDMWKGPTRRDLRYTILAVGIPFAIVCLLVWLGSIFVW